MCLTESQKNRCRRQQTLSSDVNILASVIILLDIFHVNKSLILVGVLAGGWKDTLHNTCHGICQS